MEGEGDTDFFQSESGINHYSLERMNTTRFKRNLLTNAQKSFHVLEHQSLVNCLEADKEFIISAGRDHDINIWDTIEGRHIRRLSGHTAPVTGLALYTSKEPPYEKRIVSCSEDETIIQWCLNKGEQTLKIKTKNLVTCMGMMNRSLAVVGNHRGYMQVYHMSSGDLYSTILAHLDPIDAIAVEGNYVSSAVFEAPSSLKVWEVQYEQIKCIYRIEKLVEFSCFAMWDTKVMLGSDHQELLVVDFKTDERDVIDLDRPDGRIRQVRVWNEWILSCSTDAGKVSLDVHRIHNYEHFGTFKSDVPQVNAVAAVEFDNSFKVILGGSALAVLSFDFILTEDTRLPFNRSMNVCSKTSFEWNKPVSHYTLKNPMAEQSESLGWDKDTSENEEMPYDNHPSNTSTPQSNFHTLHDGSYRTHNVDKIGERNPRLPQMLSVLTMLPNRYEGLPFDYEKSRLERMLHASIEPRAAMRKLEESLDNDALAKELEKCSVTEEPETAEEPDARVDEPPESAIKERINEEQEEETIEQVSESAEKSECEAKTVTEMLSLSKTDDKELSEYKIQTEELPEETEQNSKYNQKFCLAKKQRGKKVKKKQLEKSKHKKCEIM